MGSPPKAVPIAELTAAQTDGNKLGQQLEHVAALIKARAEDHIESERDFFFVVIGGFDTHSDEGGILTDKMQKIDAALAPFIREMEGAGTWNDVAIVSASDFGRTLTSNGRGSDHAWAGHHFVMGGDVKGGQMFGKYPPDLAETDANPLNIGRGRLIPTLGWEAIWQPLAQWFGVADDQMDFVLPNRNNFAPELLVENSKLWELRCDRCQGEGGSDGSECKQNAGDLVRMIALFHSTR